MTWQLLQADARQLPLTDNTADLIVCSPPYWGLRSYRDAGEHYDGQIGSEDTPQQFVDELVGMIDGEWRRVLKPSGSLWLNLGDKYAGSGGHNNADIGAPADRGPTSYPKGTGAARPKSLLGLPWRIALALIDTGWILRAEVIWSKPNSLPESVTDRVRRSHEQWFHLTLEPRYFAAVDEIRERHLGDESPNARRGPSGMNRGIAVGRTHDDGASVGNFNFDPLGRLPGSVWTIPSEPLNIPEPVRQHLDLVDHYAAFSSEWPRRLILGWSPAGICVECGQGRRPVTTRTVGDPDYTRSFRVRTPISGGDPSGGDVSYRVTGYACACPTPDAPTTPAVVLDPMCGTGTVPSVAHWLGRHGIGTDLSNDYLRLAKWRIESGYDTDRAQQRTARDRQGRLL